jgi:hypothetical protein
VGVSASQLIRIIAAIGLYIAVLVPVYVLHALFLPVDVVLYSALGDAAVAAALSALLIWRLRWFAPLQGSERLLLLAVWLLGGYAFAVSIPTVIDRSLSFYLLEKLHQRGGGIRAGAIERVITDEFMAEYRVTDARLTEQLASGTIVIDGDCVRLTPKGRRIAEFSSVFRAYLLPKQRLLMGEYSDDLTQPFRRSSERPDYLCP